MNNSIICPLLLISVLFKETQLHFTCYEENTGRIPVPCGICTGNISLSKKKIVILTQATLPSIVINQMCIPFVGKPEVHWFGGGTPGRFCLFPGKSQCHLNSNSGLWNWFGTMRLHDNAEMKIYHLLKCIFPFDYFFLMLCHCSQSTLVFLNSKQAPLRKIW